MSLTAQDYRNLGFTADQLMDYRQRFAPWQGDDEYARWVKKESDIGKNTTGGGAGAVGNHQLLPGTFQELIPGGNINDPLQNLQAGLMYLDRGYKKFDGNRHDIYSGYHGGMSGKGTAHWGPKTRAYADFIVANGDGGRSPLAGAGTISQDQLQRPPGNIDMIAAYNQGLPQRQSQAQNAQPQTADHSVSLDTMLPFQGIVDKTAKYAGEPYYSAFQRYSNPDFKG